jgi:hypothetical protein
MIVSEYEAREEPTSPEENVIEAAPLRGCGNVAFPVEPGSPEGRIRAHEPPLMSSTSWPEAV